MTHLDELDEQKIIDEIDWSAFEGEPIDQTLTCNCNTQYRSHAKLVMSLRKTIAKDPCPSCGHVDHIWMASSDPEKWVL